MSPVSVRRPRLGRFVAVLVIAAAVLAQPTLARAATSSDRPAPDRAMWVWDTSDPAGTVELAVSTGITRLYAAVPPNVGSSPRLGELTELTRRASAAGIRVDALGGDPGWVDNPSWVVTNWLQPTLSTGLFAGVHVDIEPYSTRAWTTKRGTVVKRWLATMDALRQGAGATPLEADIPFWLDQVPANGSTLDREIMRRTDGVAVMAYRNTATGPDGTIALSAKAIQAGGELGVPVRIGQETTYLGDDPTSVKQTFYGQSRTALETQLALVADAYATSPAFAGFAIHDAKGYAALAP